MIAKPLQIKALNNYTIWLKYDDDTEGRVNLDYLVIKPIFSKWKELDFFIKVHINKETNAIAWDENIELCPDSLYLKIKGLSFEQWKQRINNLLH